MAANFSESPLRGDEGQEKFFQVQESSRGCASKFKTPTSSDAQFTLFPELPTELRLKIWKSALPIGPRFLDLYTSDELGHRAVPASSSLKIMGHFDRDIAGVLCTNKESRAEVLKKFVPALYLQGKHYVGQHDGLVNLELDTIRIPRDYFEVTQLCLHEFRDNIFAGLRFMAIDHDDWVFLMDDMRTVGFFLQFRSLESVTVVFKCDPDFEQFWDGAISLTRPYKMAIEFTRDPLDEGFPTQYQVRVPRNGEVSKTEYDLMEDHFLDGMLEVRPFGGEDEGEENDENNENSEGGDDFHDEEENEDGENNENHEEDESTDDNPSHRDYWLERQVVLDGLLLEILEVFEACSEDLSWKVPKPDIRGFRRGGLFTS